MTFRFTTHFRDRYLLASTYISSRAFPSRLLSLGGPSASSQTSPTSTEGSEDSHPILLPGIDLLNHVPSHPISWISSPAAASGQISLIHHSPLPSANLQVFNNYGAKPNDELLLAYGFVLPSLSFDTLPLVLGGLPPDAIDEMTEFGLRANERFLLARDGVVSDELLAIARFMCADEDLMDAWEDALEQGKTGADVWGAPAATSEVEEAAAGMLLGMLEGKTRALNMEALASAEGAEDIRPDVLEMVRVYKKGASEGDNSLAYANLPTPAQVRPIFSRAPSGGCGRMWSVFRASLDGMALVQFHRSHSISRLARRRDGLDHVRANARGLLESRREEG